MDELGYVVVVEGEVGTGEEVTYIVKTSRQQIIHRNNIVSFLYKSVTKV
jgi:predicted Rossmann-fold nucleotide-binding protein